jgi:predicted nucleic acid-binding protein
MNILVDANVLVRLAESTSKLHGVAAAAVASLRTRGDVLHVVPQCVYEFWVVASRPVANNGLGLSIPECIQELADIELSFSFLDDKPTMYTEWKSIVTTIGCQGKIAHDARYVAAMRAHGLTHLMTFNVGDFARFQGLTLLDPNIIALSIPPKTTP